MKSEDLDEIPVMTSAGGKAAQEYRLSEQKHNCIVATAANSHEQLILIGVIAKRLKSIEYLLTILVATVICVVVARLF